MSDPFSPPFAYQFGPISTSAGFAEGIAFAPAFTGWTGYADGVGTASAVAQTVTVASVQALIEQAITALQAIYVAVGSL